MIQNEWEHCGNLAWKLIHTGCSIPCAPCPALFRSPQSSARRIPGRRSPRCRKSAPVPCKGPEKIFLDFLFRRLQDVSMPRKHLNRKDAYFLSCLKCWQGWPRRTFDKLPLRCPRCGSRKWNEKNNQTRKEQNEDRKTGKECSRKI